MDVVNFIFIGFLLSSFFVICCLLFRITILKKKMKFIVPVVSNYVLILLLISSIFLIYAFYQWNDYLYSLDPLITFIETDSFAGYMDEKGNYNKITEIKYDYPYTVLHDYKIVIFHKNLKN